MGLRHHTDAATRDSDPKPQGDAQSTHRSSPVPSHLPASALRSHWGFGARNSGRGHKAKISSQNSAAGKGPSEEEHQGHGHPVTPTQLFGPGFRCSGVPGGEELLPGAPYLPCEHITPGMH